MCHLYRARQGIVKALFERGSLWVNWFPALPPSCGTRFALKQNDWILEAVVRNVLCKSCQFLVAGQWQEVAGGVPVVAIAVFLPAQALSLQMARRAQNGTEVT